MADIHRFGNMKFAVGPEGDEKRKHVHVKVSGVGTVKFWLTRRVGDKDVPNIEVEPSSAKGDVDSFYQDAFEQIEVYYDDIIANINRHYKSDPHDPVQPTTGQKTKGQNSPKTVAARKAAEDTLRTSR